MSLRIGGDLVSELYIGATPIQQLYLGDVLMWQRPAQYADAFDRTAGAPGGNWLTGGTRPAVIRSQSLGLGDIGNSDGTFAGWARWAAPLNTAEQIVAASLVSAPSSQVTALVARANSDLTSMVVAEVWNGGCAISTYTGGTRTQRASTASTVSAGQTLGLRVTAAGVVQLLRNGAALATWTDSGGVIPTSQRHVGALFAGARSFFSNSYCAQLDNWAAADVLT